MNTHTPGPWTLSADGQRILGIETPDEQPAIATIYGAACEDQEGAANARLIAAAPDMLAALEMAIEWADDVPKPYREFQFITATRAAIAKAKL